MTETVKPYLRKLPLLLLAAGVSPMLQAAVETPFTAAYEVSIDGKPRLETRISFQRQGDGWLMTSESTGTRGLPRILRASSLETSSVTRVENHYRPDSFKHSSSIAGSENEWEAAFDWESHLVSTRHEEGNSSLALSGMETDPLSLTLKIRENLALGLQQFTLNVVDEDEISQQDYQAGSPVDYSSTLGCFRTVPVERIRENSKRYSTGWYAESIQFIPVRVVHGKQGGKEFEMKIISLTLDDKPVTGANDCSL